MNITISNNTNALAFLLALKDYAEVLSEPEKQTLREIAKELKTQPKAWEKYIEPKLLQTIQANPQLHQTYQVYKGKLECLENLPIDLLPKTEEVRAIAAVQQTLITRGFDFDEIPSNCEKLIENAMIVVGTSDIPEKAVKQINSLDKLKQFINDSSQ